MTKPTKQVSPSRDPSVEHHRSSQALDAQESHPSAEKELDFEGFYLKQLTEEFAEDLDKVRNANDFNDRSLPVLIEALKGGASIYSEEQRKRIMGN